MMPERRDDTDMDLNSRIRREAEELRKDLEECNTRLKRKVQKQNMIIISLKGMQTV